MALDPRPKRSLFRRVERWLVGLAMAVIAFALERAVLRSIKKGRTKPGPSQAPPAHPLTLEKSEITSDEG